MASLLDVRRGDIFLLAFRCVDRDPVIGLTLNIFSVVRSPVGQLIIAPGGAFTGQLAAPPDQVLIKTVTGFAPLEIGDIMSRDETGETVVCRWTQIKPDGTVIWSSSPSGKVVYTATGWSVIGHINL